ncbi:MAG: hypothetical protein ABJA80_09910 [bacterium]
MTFARLSAIVAFAACALSAGGVAHAQLAPYHRYRTLDTPHFRLTVAEGLEREGRVAAAAAERAYALLAKELHEPRGTIDLIVSDDADYSNGYASPVPGNRIVVFATPSVDAGSLRLNEDWLGIVITHELTHIFHLDRVRGVWRFAQDIFGRAPALFPNSYGPSWLTEGLAVYYESRLTEGGRLKDSESRMIARAAALEHALPTLDALSLGSPRFPGGTGAYGYGALFVAYLARTRGDSTVRRFIDTQSASLVPWAIDADARRGFGVGFGDAYAAFSDSLQRSVGDLRPPLPGWRELTTHGYYALDPRWTSDSSLVYAASDGRSTGAAYALSLDGTRHRIGRRNALGPSVPFGGGLLFAQPDYATTSEVRSDLYVDAHGEQHRLTRGLRLIQPDARQDGTIVAVQIAPARASLMLLDSAGGERRLLRDAAADETWSEPRWSPDGSAIAVSHRTHGGTFSIEVIDVATGVARVLDRGPYVLATPSWNADGSVVLYTTEQFGVPTLAWARADGQGLHTIGSLAGGDSSATGVYGAVVSPTGRTLAATSLRADGYHVGITSLRLFTEPAVAATGEPNVMAAMPIDSQPLAAGEFHAYSAWRTVRPRYWYPVLDHAAGSGYLLGASSSGSDILSRHLYDASLSFSTKGAHPVASINYRYAGLRRPYIDLALSQDYLLERDLVSGTSGQSLGTLLRRVRFAALSTAFVRPRYRTYTALAFGATVEHRSFLTDPGALYARLADSTYTRSYVFPGAFASVQWSNLQRPALSISAEDGISTAATVRVRAQSGDVSRTVSTSVVGTMAGFKSLDLPGFAHHVLALRLAGGTADSRSASSFVIGGTSGTAIQLVPGYSVGEGRRTFGVRGFDAGTAYGTSAASGTLEYRAPLTLGGRGFGGLPLFFDRASVSAFTDAAVATCAAAPLFANACATSPRIGRTIASAGAELVLSAAVLDWDTAQNLRVGVAAPIAARDLAPRPVSAYLAYGFSF